MSQKIHTPHNSKFTLFRNIPSITLYVKRVMIRDVNIKISSTSGFIHYKIYSLES